MNRFSGLTERFIDAMHADERILNVPPPDQGARATGHIAEIIELIQKLERAGWHIREKTGMSISGVREFEVYGALSGRSLDDLQAGARVEKDESKDDPRILYCGSGRTRRADVELAMGWRVARLAHRVLSYVDQMPGRAFRYSRWRHGPQVSTS